MSKTKKITLSAFFLALGIIMPFLTAQIPSVGSMLLPMHLPVLLCGYVLGSTYGSLIGFITPLLRSFLFQMPPMLNATCMAFELAAYGFFTGFFYHKLKKNTISVYISLIFAMILGRIVWGFASMMILGFNNTSFTFATFIAGGFTNAIPGMILQLILIPILVKVLEKARVINGK